MYPGADETAGALLATEAGKDQTEASPAGKTTRPALSPSGAGAGADAQEAFRQGLAATQGDSTVQQLLYPAEGASGQGQGQARPPTLLQQQKLQRKLRAEQQRISHFKTLQGIVARHNGQGAKDLMYKQPEIYQANRECVWTLAEPAPQHLAGCATLAVGMGVGSTEKARAGGRSRTLLTPALPWPCASCAPPLQGTTLSCTTTTTAHQTPTVNTSSSTSPHTQT